MRNASIPSRRAALLAARAVSALALAAAVLAPASATVPGCAGKKECNIQPAKVSEDPALPDYKPTPGMSGEISIFGSMMGGQVDAWIEAFKAYQPGIAFKTKFPSSDGAAAGLISGVADIGSAGREAMLSEHLAFAETFLYDLYEATVATGSYNIRGRTPSVVIYVNKDNPIDKLTVDQLDGIFGSERSGAYEGYYWRSNRGRGPEKDIRSWGQLGLGGAWASQPIRTHGYALTGMTEFFNRTVFKGGDKWNPNYQEHVESFTKMVPNGDFGLGASQYMMEQIVKDRYAIGWSFIPQQDRMRSGEVKQVAIGTSPAGPFYLPTLENSLSRKYPLTRSVFFYLKKDPKTGLKPEVAEFMRFIYSRQGQAAVAKLGVYLPLPAQTAAQQFAASEAQVAAR